MTHSWILQSRFSLQKTRARSLAHHLPFLSYNKFNSFLHFYPARFFSIPAKRRRCQRTAFILRRQTINPGAGPRPSSRTLLSPFELKLLLRFIYFLGKSIARKCYLILSQQSGKCIRELQFIIYTPTEYFVALIFLESCF